MEQERPRTAFVSGSTGFLGRNLIEQLTAGGWAVTALHRASSDVSTLERYTVRLAVGDVCDPASLRQAMPASVDVVFHVAADTAMWSGHNERQTRTNVDGTRNMVTVALEKGCRRFVHTSTWNTYGLEQGVLSEASPQRGAESWINYERTKYLAEQAVRSGIKRGLAAVILNPCHIIGRYDRHNWSRFVVLVAENQIPAVPPGGGCFCHGEEVAKAHIAAAERGRTGENYLLGGPEASFSKLAQIIGELTGRPVPTRTVPALLLRSAARAAAAVAAVTGKEPTTTPEGVAVALAHARIVSSKAEDELGYRHVPLGVMLKDCLDWLASEGLIGASNAPQG
jgi:dihydroflavonol-4-reductase